MLIIHVRHHRLSKKHQTNSPFSPSGIFKLFYDSKCFFSWKSFLLFQLKNNYIMFYYFTTLVPKTFEYVKVKVVMLLQVSEWLDRSLVTMVTVVTAVQHHLFQNLAWRCVNALLLWSSGGSALTQSGPLIVVDEAPQVKHLDQNRSVQTLRWSCEAAVRGSASETGPAPFYPGRWP